MDLGKAGWLSSMLEESVAAHMRAPAPVVPPGLSDSSSGRAHARSYLRRMLRASGLLYGTPADGGVSSEAVSSESAGTAAPEEVLFRAVVRTFARMALDIAVLAGAPLGPRREQLLLLFAVLTGQLEEAQAIEEKLRQGHEAPKRLWGRVEDALERRALSLSGDPAYGLVLHNGALYADGHMFGRQALDYFSRGGLNREMARRRIDFAARQKALLVEVLTGLACVDRQPSFSARRAILRQVEDLGLPDALESELRTAVRQSFERRRSLSMAVKDVRSVDLRRFILEQTLLASLVDGRRTRGERAFIDQLSHALRVPESTVHQLELEVAEFYAKNRSVVDVFTVSSAANLLGEDMVSRMQNTLERNFHRLMQEVRETGELYHLLTKAARGQTLTAGERQRMRAQLIDVAKAIPALAIFAAPGGMLLLVALAKVLPFNLLPSSFQDEPEPAGPEGDGTGGGGEPPVREVG
ncbi:LETM1 domain-containing protein [Archangium violaceum]|uniref:LETM1 domain-containing protein n=1 Tax=Archangium violaceum TaxID=83451 RepID=UPI000698F323|nr:LETM1 domain-containing protein [Archangium violaceum]